MNVTSLACSLAGIFIGLSLIPGIIFGHLGRSAAKQGQATNGGLGLAGMIIGYVVLAIAVVSVILLVAILGWFIDGCEPGDTSAACQLSN